MSSTFQQSLLNKNVDINKLPEITARSRDYIRPLRCEVEIWDLKKNDQLFYYDAFGSTKNNFSLYQTQVSQALGNVGSFSLSVNASDWPIDFDKLDRKHVVIVRGKKRKDQDWKNLIYAFSTKLSPVKPATNVKLYNLTGYGSGIILNERIVNYKRVAKRQSEDSTLPVFDDPNTRGFVLYKDLFTARDILAVSDVTISEQGGFDLNNKEISEKVTDNVYGIHEPYVEASQIRNILSESLGVNAGVDAYNRPFMRYATQSHGNVIVKASNYDDLTRLADSALYTSYFLGTWTYGIDWNKESGFSNRLIAKARTNSGDSEGSSGDFTNNSFEPLSFQDLGVKFKPRTTRFNDITLIVSKIGRGYATAPNMHGHIIKDLGGFPIGPTIAHFTIPIQFVPDTPQPLFLSHITTTGRIDPDSDYWIVLYARGTHRDTNSQMWYRDENTLGTIATRSELVYSDGGDHNTTTGWEVQENVPVFIHNIFSSYTHAVIAEDPASIDRYGIVEDMIPVEWANDSSTVNKYLTEILFYKARPRMTFTTNTVTIPDELFSIGDLVSIIDPKADLPKARQVTAEIESITYNFGNDGQTIGAKDAEISLIGYWDYKKNDNLLLEDICTF